MPSPSAPENLPQLSACEQDALEKLAKGFLVKEIADQLA
jgi:hypothetical protein